MENLFTNKMPLYFGTEEPQLVLGDSFKILTKWNQIRRKTQV